MEFFKRPLSKRKGRGVDLVSMYSKARHYTERNRLLQRLQRRKTKGIRRKSNQYPRPAPDEIERTKDE